MRFTLIVRASPAGCATAAMSGTLSRARVRMLFRCMLSGFAGLELHVIGRQLHERLLKGPPRGDEFMEPGPGLEGEVTNLLRTDPAHGEHAICPFGDASASPDDRCGQRVSLRRTRLHHMLRVRIDELIGSAVRDEFAAANYHENVSGELHF